MRATLDSLQEFRVTTSNYDASAGRSSGAQVNLVTKSGTNKFHGSVYEYYRPNFTVANDWFNKQAELNSRIAQCARHSFFATRSAARSADRSRKTGYSSSQPMKASDGRPVADHAHHPDPEPGRRKFKVPLQS